MRWACFVRWGPGAGSVAAALPVAQKPFDLIAQRLPVDIAGHGQDGSLWAKVAGVVAAQLVGGQALDAGDGAAVVVAERARVMVLAQLDEDTGPRLVFQAAQVLHGQGLDGIQFLVRQMRSPKNVGVVLQGRGQVARHRGAPEAGVQHTDGLAAVQAQVVQGQRQIAAVEITRAAR